MKVRSVGAGVVMLALLTAAAGAQEQSKLKVLYMGAMDTPRAKAYVELLGKNFARAAGVERDKAQPADAEWADVVVVDWPQAGIKWDKLDEMPRPLGAREKWSKPTVLLGSAGLVLARLWQTSGAYG